MDNNYLSSGYIEKLGHSIQEIRERTLLNIVSKLDRGFIYDNELARCKELLMKLFDWFKYEDCNHEDIALSLILRIFKSDSGDQLINLFGKHTLTEELTQIRNICNEEYHPLLQDIIEFLESNSNNNPLVPPLEVYPPLSYRTNDTLESKSVESTASSIVGFIKHSESIDDEAGFQKSTSSSAITSKERNSFHIVGLKFYTLPWQPLVAPDRHVLESVEESLRNPSEPSTLLNSCEFFNNILLHDFPAEIFLQRPAIIKLFHDTLWSSPSSRITTAVLECLEKLTKTLKSRILFLRDPCTYNNKELKMTYSHIINIDPCLEQFSSEDQDNLDDSETLVKSQMTLPHYCINTINAVFDYLYIPPETRDKFKRKKCQIGNNTALSLLNSSIELLKMCITREIWNNKEIDHILVLQNKLNEILIKFGEVLGYYRLQVISCDWNEDIRMIHLYLICTFTDLFNNLVPLNNCDAILPRNLKNAIADCALDPAFSRLYPSIHENILEIIKSFNSAYETEAYKKYEQVKKIYKSMSSCINFIRKWKSMPTNRNIILAKQSLISLEFHKILKFLDIFIDICANKLSMHTFEKDVLKQIDTVIVSCLAHNCEEIKLESYKLCHKRVIATIGAKLNVSKASAPGSQILFLLRQKVLEEFAIYGTTSNNTEIQTYAEDILIHILKCKILVSDEIWKRAVLAIIPTIPIFICHVNQTALGRAILSTFDPDRSLTLNIPTCEVIRSNVGLLFSNNAQIREEAVSRLCWILSSQRDSHRLLPHINNLHDKALGLICQLDRLTDYNRLKSMQNFYQPNGLHQVMELLNSDNVEPVIRRSAVTQISVMVEDPIMHQTFIELKGIDTIKSVIFSALIEDDYKDYPDSIIACITILKNICLYSAFLRQQLANEVDVYIHILRGIFMFCTEERVKQDGSTLLFLLTFSNYIQGSPLKNDFSVSDIIVKHLKCPFLCKAHGKSSENTLPTLKSITDDKWVLSSLQIHWNTEWYGGLQEILKLEKVEGTNKLDFDNLLKLTRNDLLAVKSSSLEYCIEKYLCGVESGVSHQEVMDYINKLTNCFNLYYLSKQNIEIDLAKLSSFSWAKSFERYLNVPPSGAEDSKMLAHIVQFLCLVMPMLKSAAADNWIYTILNDPNHYFVNLLASEDAKESKQLKNAVLELITVNIKNQQYHLNFDMDLDSKENWYHFIEVIVENLEFNDAQHFYNLAYLDKLLSTLVYLTSSYGWSNSQLKELPKKFLIRLISGLCELIGAFHCGKGPSATVSLMGLSITRHVMLILNHVLAEMQNFQVKNWEDCFTNSEINDENGLASLCSLYGSRDVTLRAAVFHFLAGIALSTRAASVLIADVQINNLDIWEISLSTFLNQNEASVVRENVASFLTNLISHTVNIEDDISLRSSLLPSKWAKENGVGSILRLLEEYSFYREMTIIFKNLYVYDNYYPQYVYDGQETLRTDSSLSCGAQPTKDGNIIICTPGLIKSASQFTNNLLALFPLEVLYALQESGIVKLFLRCLIVPSISIENMKDLFFYCDILEMNASVCSLLTYAASKSSECSNIICNTRDCLSIILSLLNPSLYINSRQELLYLRNKLWCSIFNLMEVILHSNQGEISNTKAKEAFKVLTNLLVESGQGPFLQTLFASITTTVSNDLQLSALSSLTSLLSIDSEEQDDIPSAHNSMQALLDFTKTPRSPDNDVENMKQVENKISTLDILENIYFGKMSSTDNSTTEKDYDSEEDLMAGAELCKLLLRLYDFVNLKTSASTMKKRLIIINTLTSLLSKSIEAKAYALRCGFLSQILYTIKEIHIKLSLESADCLKRISDKKRVCPVLKDLESFIGLLTNFMANNEYVKNASASLGLADIIHKLWPWFMLQKSLLICTLRMLCTFTGSCPEACQSFPFTTSVAGAGPRKVPSNVSLLHAICTLIGKEMEQVSKTHDLTMLELCFHILQNCTLVTDCRIILVKNNLLQNIMRLHPAITKRQKPWETVELLWLDFLLIFTTYPEGQLAVTKSCDVFELLVTLTSSNKLQNRHTALEILRNISFYQQNRARLLTSGDFLNMLSTKLSSGSIREKNIIVSIIWILAANNQKAKVTFKCAHIDSKLKDVVKSIHLSNVPLEAEDLRRMMLVVSLFKEGEVR